MPLSGQRRVERPVCDKNGNNKKGNRKKKNIIQANQKAGRPFNLMKTSGSTQRKKKEGAHKEARVLSDLNFINKNVRQ